MIKILYIIDRMKAAGAQQHLEQVTAALDKDKFEYRLITLEALGVKKIYGLSGLLGLFCLIRIIKDNKFDIVHTYLFSENILGSIAAKISGVRVIITSRRDAGVLCQGGWRNVMAYKFTNRWVDKIVCVSEAVKKVTLEKEKVEPGKLSVIYNGIDVSKFNRKSPVKDGELKVSLGIKAGEFIVGMVANFSWIKGHKEFIDAAEQILDEMTKVTFLLIGDGPLRKHYKQYCSASSKLSQKVCFLGSRNDIPDLLSIMDISVNSSYSEGMSNTILQSMAVGVPVVATAVDGNLETVVNGVTGVLVPPKNPQAMAEAIIRILRDKELAQKMRENARNLIKEKFTIEIMLSNMENLYKRLLKPKMAFLLSQFPETHETFILREFNALANKGLEFEIFSLKQCKDKVIHPEAVNLMNKTTYIKARQLINSLVYIIFHPIKTCNAFYYVLRTFLFNPPNLLKALYVFLECLYLARIMKKKSISHIHSHWATIPTTATVILNKLTGVSFSFTAHAWDIFVNQNGLAEKINAAKFVVTCTDYNRKFLNNFSKNRKVDKLYLNYHGIDLNKLQICQPATSLTQQLNILAIGRLVEQKGFEHLIAACNILQNKGIDFQCSIVGSGPLEKKLKFQIKNYKLQSKIIFLATKTQEEIKKLFNETVIFIQPSVIAKNGDRDGIPNVILESLAYGIPIIATDVSGIPEAVINAKTGILVKPADSVALANAIEQLWADKQMQLKFSKNGRDLVQDKFDVYKNTEELAGIFVTNGIINYDE